MKERSSGLVRGIPHNLLITLDIFLECISVLRVMTWCMNSGAIKWRHYHSNHFILEISVFSAVLGMRSDLNRRWNSLAPYIFDYESSVNRKEELLPMSKEIRNFYLGDRRVNYNSKELLHNVIEFFLFSVRVRFQRGQKHEGGRTLYGFISLWICSLRERLCGLYAVYMLLFFWKTFSSRPLGTDILLLEFIKHYNTTRHTDHPHMVTTSISRVD